MGLRYAGVDERPGMGVEVSVGISRSLSASKFDGVASERESLDENLRLLKNVEVHFDTGLIFPRDEFMVGSSTLNVSSTSCGQRNGNSDKVVSGASTSLTQNELLDMRTRCNRCNNQPSYLAQ